MCEDSIEARYRCGRLRALECFPCSEQTSSNCHWRRISPLSLSVFTRIPGIRRQIIRTIVSPANRTNPQRKRFFSVNDCKSRSFDQKSFASSFRGHFWWEFCAKIMWNILKSRNKSEPILSGFRLGSATSRLAWTASYGASRFEIWVSNLTFGILKFRKTHA